MMTKAQRVNDGRTFEKWLINMKRGQTVQTELYTKTVQLKEFELIEFEEMRVKDLVRHRSHFISLLEQNNEDTYVGAMASLNLLTIVEALYGTTSDSLARKLFKKKINEKSEKK